MVTKKVHRAWTNIWLVLSNESREIIVGKQFHEPCKRQDLPTHMYLPMIQVRDSNINTQIEFPTKDQKTAQIQL